MKLCSFLCILSHAAEIHWANTGKVAKKNAKRREKKKARQFSRDPMSNQSTSNLSFESDIHEEASGKGLESSTTTTTTTQTSMTSTALTSTTFQATKSSSETYPSTEAHEEKRTLETEEELSCPGRVEISNKYFFIFKTHVDHVKSP